MALSLVAAAILPILTVVDESLVGWLVVITLCAGLIVPIMLNSRFLPLESHLIFYFVYAQMFVYLFAAPTGYALGELSSRPDLVDLYVLMEILAFALFLIPCVIVYRAVTKLLEGIGPRQRGVLTLRPRQQVIFVLLMAGIAVIYLLALISNGLLFRRIGHAGLATAFVELPRWSYLVIRVFDRLALAVICLLVIIALQPQSRWRRRMTLTALILVGGIHFSVTGLNSRFASVQGLALISIVFLCWSGDRFRIDARLLVRIALVCCLALFLVQVTMNARAGGGQLAIRPALLNPFSQVDRVVQVVGSDGTPLTERLNCVDFMVRISPEAWADGYARGRAWIPPIISVLGPFFAPERAQEYRLSLRTTSKVALLSDYGGLNVDDYPSCMVGDAYGNLGPPGMLLAGIFYGLLIALANHLFTRPRAGWHVSLGLVMFLIFTYFEHEFIALTLLAWFQHLPSLILLLLLNPLALDRPGGRKDPVPRRGS